MLVDPAVRTRVVILDRANLALLDNASRSLVPGLLLEVLRDAPHKALRLPLGLVLLHERPAALHVRRDRLLAEDVLARRERPADDVRLGRDGEHDDDACDVSACEERVERLRLVSALVVVNVELVLKAEGMLCVLGERGRALDRARVDCLEVDNGGAERGECWEVG